MSAVTGCSLEWASVLSEKAWETLLKTSIFGLKQNFPFRHPFLSFYLQKVTFNWLLTNVGVGDCNWLLTRVGVGDCNWLLTKVGVDDVCNWLLTKVGVEDVCNWLLTKVGVADGRCCCKISCMVGHKCNSIVLFHLRANDTYQRVKSFI